MIKAEVTMPRHSKWSEFEVDKWCHTCIGNRAIWSDNVNEHNPWHKDYKFGHIIYQFAREEDATMFSLKWAGNENS